MLRRVDAARYVSAGRLRRLREELVEEQLGVVESAHDPDLLIDEIDYALRPPRHERRLPTYGAIVTPTQPTRRWQALTGLDLTISPTPQRSDAEVRRYADGEVSWAVRDGDGVSALAVFDRSAASERDIVIISEASEGVVVQRRADGAIRLAGSFGVVRWDSSRWHLEPPITRWLRDAGNGLLTECSVRERDLMVRLLQFAVHDLGASGIGALLVLGASANARIEERLPHPPPLTLHRPAALGPLRHVLAQTDGAAIFDTDGVLRHLGARLVPTPRAEEVTPAIGGTRHTSARRFSFDQPDAVVVAVSDDGPVTVFRGGEMVGRSPNDT